MTDAIDDAFASEFGKRKFQRKGKTLKGRSWRNFLSILHSPSLFHKFEINLKIVEKIGRLHFAKCNRSLYTNKNRKESYIYILKRKNKQRETWVNRGEARVGRREAFIEVEVFTETGGRETKGEKSLRGRTDKPWIPVVVTYLPWHALAAGGFHVIMAGFNVQAAHVACYIIKKRNVCANWQATKAPLVTHRALQTDRAIHPSRGGKMFKQPVKRRRGKILANTTTAIFSSSNKFRNTNTIAL